MKNRLQRYAILLLLPALTSVVIAQGKWHPYINPAIQIGYEFGEGGFWAGQITVGTFNDDGVLYESDKLLPVPGTTLG